MDMERAKDINGRLCWAYFAMEKLTGKPPPDLRDVSLADAQEASRIISSDDGIREPDGSVTYPCHVAERALPAVLAFANYHAAQAAAAE